MRKNIFVTKSSRKDVPEARIDRGASLFPSDIATDRAMAPGFCFISNAKSVVLQVKKIIIYY